MSGAAEESGTLLAGCGGTAVGTAREAVVTGGSRGFISTGAGGAGSAGSGLGSTGAGVGTSTGAGGGTGRTTIGAVTGGTGF